MQGEPHDPGACTNSWLAASLTRCIHRLCLAFFPPQGEHVILVRMETSPEDVGGMHAAGEQKVIRCCRWELKRGMATSLGDVEGMYAAGD